jgi:hypothetical protein
MSEMLSKENHFRNFILMTILALGLLSSYLTFQYQFSGFGFFDIIFKMIFPGAPFLLLVYYFTAINRDAPTHCILISCFVMALSVAFPYALPYLFHSAVISTPLLFIAMPFYTAIFTFCAIGICQYLSAGST